MSIAITGATGFLGLRLLPLLIARGGPVVVLAHAGTAPAMDRIVAQFRASGLPTETTKSLVILNVDLTRPRLGLPQWQFQALASQLSEIWHCAALVDLAAPAASVQPVNVVGTRAVLGLAAAGTAMTYHVSTAFVAGRRRTGLIGEGDLDASYGFETCYEESKFEAEQAVHEWSRRSGRPVVIFRPSVLITDRPPLPGGATHILSRAFAFSDAAGAFLAQNLGPGERLPVRIAARPDAHINLIPVELTARLMVDLADRIQPQGVCTAHVTYPHEVGMATIHNLIEHRYPVKLVLTPELPQDPTLFESLVAAGSHVAPYGLHHRYYDRGALRATGLDPSDAPLFDEDYLLSGL
jgi:thioester reductase-like protein